MYIDRNGDRWYRGNLHTHTTRSDGRKSPEDTKAAYKAAGYDFIALTDHWKYSENNDSDPSGLLTLSGTEYNFGGEDTLGGVYHIVGVGMTSDPLEVISKSSTPQQTVNEILRCGGAAIFAHPAWSMNTWEMMASLKDYTMTEIYNSVSGVPHNCRPYSGIVIDELALRGYYPRLCATDDTHFWDGEQMLSFIYVNLHKNEFNHDSLMSAILAGDFYATQGPRFSCRLETDGASRKLVVDCEPDDGVERVTIFTNRPWINNRSVLGNPVTEAVFELGPKDTFVRAEVVAGNKTGWGQIFPIPRG